jgi:hypothetical protein
MASHWATDLPSKHFFVKVSFIKKNKRQIAMTAKIVGEN